MWFFSEFISVFYLVLYWNRKHGLNCHRMKPALFSVLCEIKEKTGKTFNKTFYRHKKYHSRATAHQHSDVFTSQWSGFIQVTGYLRLNESVSFFKHVIVSNRNSMLSQRRELSFFFFSAGDARVSAAASPPALAAQIDTESALELSHPPP